MASRSNQTLYNCTYILKIFDIKKRLEGRGKIEKAYCIPDVIIVYRRGLTLDLSGVFLGPVPAGVAAKATKIIIVG
jgi:hypothetical protein